MHMLETGYIYLTVDELRAGALVHLVSGVDQECRHAVTGGATSTAITGYTEWISQGERVLTLGWDWQMCTSGDTVHLQRIGPPSSNLMLQSATRHDLGHARTVELLNAYVDSFDWQQATLGHINVRYA
jgi:hypothetical protein